MRQVSLPFPVSGGREKSGTDACYRLIKSTVEGLRTKLDRIYLEALDTSMRSVATRRVSADEVSTLQQELESLYAEILPVAQMSVEQQFLEPALKNLAARQGQGVTKSEEAIQYVGNRFSQSNAAFG